MPLAFQNMVSNFFFEKSAIITEIVELLRLSQFRYLKKWALVLNQAAKIEPWQIERSGFYALPVKLGLIF